MWFFIGLPPESVKKWIFNDLFSNLLILYGRGSFRLKGNEFKLMFWTRKSNISKLECGRGFLNNLSFISHFTYFLSIYLNLATLQVNLYFKKQCWYSFKVQLITCRYIRGEQTMARGTQSRPRCCYFKKRKQKLIKKLKIFRPVQTFCCKSVTNHFLNHFICSARNVSWH